MTDQFDLTHAVEIHQGISWVGVPDKETPFKCNPYLLEDGDEAVLFEPGSTLYYPGVRDKVNQLKQRNKIRYLLFSHQDPDLCGSLPIWEETLDINQFQIITHSRTAVLLRHYGIKSKFYLVDQNNWSLRFRSGRELKFIFAPWCHCPGTFMTYDEKSKTLFSGDIFGALTFDWTLYAGDHYPEAMRGFHEDYMASTPHLQGAMLKIQSLAIERIAPQHGSIINRNVGDHIRSLQNLRCGLTLMESEQTILKKGFPVAKPGSKSYRDLIGFVLEREIGVLGADQAISTAKGLSGLEIDRDGRVLSVKGDEKELLGKLLSLYHERFGIWAILHCKMALISMALESGLVLPKM